MIFLTFSLYSYSQINQKEDDLSSETRCVTIGVLNGGGSLFGVDLEFLTTKRVAFQIGAGIVGYGAGLNYHLKPKIRSSFISIQYWNQGFDESFTQNIIGPSYVYRSQKGFTFQLGIGKTLDKGPAYPDNTPQPPIALLYSVGWSFPK